MLTDFAQCLVEARQVKAPDDLGRPLTSSSSSSSSSSLLSSSEDSALAAGAGAFLGATFLGAGSSSLLSSSEELSCTIFAGGACKHGFNTSLPQPW